MCICVRYHDKTKTPDRNDLKHGTVVVLNTMSKPTDFKLIRSGIKGTGSSYRMLAPAATWQIKLITIFYENYKVDNIKLQYIA